MARYKATHICIKNYKASVMHYDCFVGYKVRIVRIDNSFSIDDRDIWVNFIGSPIKRGFCSVSLADFDKYFAPINNTSKVLYQRNNYDI